MTGMIIEIVVIAFVMGGIIGAVTALHLSTPAESSAERIAVRINEKNKRR